MSSVHLGLVNAIAAELVPAVISSIGRQRRRRLTDDQDTAVNVFLARSRVQAVYGGAGTPVECVTAVQVECIARCGANTTPEAAVDPLWQSVHQRLIGSATLLDMGFNFDQDMDLEWDQIEDDTRLGAVQLTYRMRHQAAVTL